MVGPKGLGADVEAGLPAEDLDMDRMEAWEWVLLAVVGFVALGALATLMRRRGEQLLGQLRQEMVREQQKKRLAEQKQKSEQKKKEQAARPAAVNPQPGRPAPAKK